MCAVVVAVKEKGWETIEVGKRPGREREQRHTVAYTTRRSLGLRVEARWATAALDRKRERAQGPREVPNKSRSQLGPSRSAYAVVRLPVATRPTQPWMLLSLSLRRHADKREKGVGNNFKKRQKTWGEVERKRFPSLFAAGPSETDR